MKKKLLYLIVPLIFVSASYLWRVQQGKTNPTQFKKVISDNRKLFLGKRKSIVRNGPIQLSQCDSLLEQLNEFDMTDEIPEDVDKLDLDGCEHEKIKQVKESCAKKDQQCVVELTFLRSILRTRGVDFSNEKEMIADLILAEFGKKTPDFKKLEKLLNELLNQHPENKTYQKLWAMNKLLANIEKKPFPKNLKANIYDRLDPEVLDNPELMSFRLFLETGLNPHKAETFARNMVDQFPNRSDSYEVLGWSLWQQNRREEAISQLEKAISINPKDQWLKDMYSRARAPNAPSDSFQGRMNIGVKIEDLYQ